MKKLLFIFSLCLVSLVANATNYLTETFTAGTIPNPQVVTTGSTDGSGWTVANATTATWASTGSRSITAGTTGITYTKSGQQSLNISGTGNTFVNNYTGTANCTSYAIKPLTSTVSTGTVYLSFIFNSAGPSSFGSNGQILALTSATAATSAIALWGRQITGSTTTFTLGLTRTSTSAAQIQNNLTALNYGTTYLFVLRYDFDTSTGGTTGTAKAYVNPIVGGTESSETAWITDNSGTGTLLASAGYLIQRGNGSSKSLFKAAGIKVSSTWGEAVAATLDTPTPNAATSITSSSFQANWAANSNASSYTLNVYQSDGTTLVNSYSGIGTNSYTVNSGLSLGTAYKYKVIAIGNGSSFYSSAESAAQSVTTAAGTPPLDTPSPSSATSISTDRFTANWGSVANIVTYTLKVYQSDGTTLVGSPYTGLNGTSQLVTGLTKGTTYKYTIIAVGDGSNYLNSSESSPMSVTTTLPLLTAPTISSATNSLAESFTANWTNNDANATGYSIKIYNSTPTLVKTVSVTGQTTSTVNITGLLVNTSYTYTVTAIADAINYVNSTESSTSSFSTQSTYPTSISTNFSDLTWGTVYTSSNAPSLGNYPVYTVNGWDLTHAYIQSGTNTGPKGEAHSCTLRLDKTSPNNGVLYLPTVASVAQVEIHSSATSGRTYVLDVSYNGGSYSNVGTYTATGSEKIDIISVSGTNAKFRITDTSSGQYVFYQIILRPNNPALLTAPTVGTATNIKATTATTQWTTPLDANATNFEVKVYKVILSASTPGLKTETTTLKATSTSTNGSSTSANVTGLQADSIYVFKVKAVGNGDVNYSDSYQTISSAQFTMAHQDYYQTQASGNWGDVSTWQSSTDNATWSNTIITPSSASSVASIAILNGHTVTVAANATASALTVNAGAKLTLNNSISLTAGTLNINSDNTHGTATFVDNGGTLTAGTTNVQQYLSAGRNWYVSSPVSTATSNVFTAASNILYSYDETNAAWPQITDNVTGLGVMTGYVANMATEGAVTFTGALNTGAQQISLSRHTGIAKEGFNLVGNPYTSYLNFESALASTSTANVSQTMWFRSKNADTYVFDAYNALNHIGTSNNNNNLIGVTAQIPPMQAVWVRVDVGQTTGTLAVDNSMRSHQDQSIVTNRFKAPATTVPVLHLQVTNGTTSDEAIVLFNSNASNGYDAYDSEKMTNANASIPEIYTLAGTEQLVINGLNSIQYDTEIPLGFTTGQSNTFTIKASQFSNFVSGTQIILRDKLVGTEQDLTVADYSFSSDIVSTSNRFSLIFRAPSVATGINSASNNNTWISTNSNNQVVINGGGSVVIYNAVGQKLSAKNLTANTTVIETPLQSGVYMVAVTNAGKTITQKVIIK